MDGCFRFVAVSLLIFVSVVVAETRPIVGVTAHLRSEKELRALPASNVSSFRIDLLWDEVERQRGQLVIPARYDHLVDTAARSGIKPLLILCYSNPNYDNADYPSSRTAIKAYARFCAFAVRHFRGRVQFYEVWNEWNIGIGMQGRPAGSARDYVRLLAAAYKSIKKADPSVTVLGAAIGGTGLSDNWLPTACQYGLLRHLDGLSFHPYCFGAGDSERLPDFGLLLRVQQVESCLSNYAHGKGVPLYITEIGWPSGKHPYRSTEREQAAFLYRTYLSLFRSPRIKGIWWYDLCNDGRNRRDPEDNFGLMDYDMSPKPSLKAMQMIGWVFSHYRRPVGLSGSDKTVKCLRLTSNDGTQSCYVFWTVLPHQATKIGLRSDPIGAVAPVQLVNGTGRAKVMTCIREPGDSSSHLVITVTDTPSFIIVSRDVDIEGF